MVFTDNQKFPDNSFIVLVSIILTETKVGVSILATPLIKDKIIS